MVLVGCGEGYHPGDTGGRLERLDQGDRKEGDEFQRPVEEPRMSVWGEIQGVT